MLETPDAVRARLMRQLQDQVARRLQNATSVNASDAAMQDHKYAVRRLEALTDAQLLERAIDVLDPAEAELEQRMHQALKAAWKYVDVPFVSRSAKNEVRRFVEATSVAGQRVAMLFALQTAWTFVHGSGNEALMEEVSELRRLGASTKLPDLPAVSA